ncbi:PREDICTED: hydroxyacid oxidase 2-like [Priapulus caudatus]|uniref:Hydroxyacid oxidase 2-like n=1 Tax=Priapulus caudatus TaxID=37621 RepID=A0ABM1F0P8_PRICU|nr:PREDICTED: hydroxyacid oxidase 2-like [Priapulus caudatus]
MATPVCLDDFEKYAEAHLSRMAWDYFSSGSLEMTTVAENRKAFHRLRIRPTALCDVSTRDVTTTLLGERVACPIGVSPTSLQCLAHADGEEASARAAAALDVCYVQSTFSTRSVADVVAAAPTGLKWLQVFPLTDFGITERLIALAEAAGYRAIVFTVDHPAKPSNWTFSRRPVGLPPGVSIRNIEAVLPGEIDESNVYAPKPGLKPTGKLSWHVVERVRQLTKLPVILKGILTAEDARLAINHGAAAIWVSNHGGRTLDGQPAAIEALPEVVAAVGGRVEVYMDSGVRTGADVFKALALGARAVFVGRPVLWGLAYDGADGVKKVLEILREELDSTMAFGGCSSIGEIVGKLRVVHKSYYKQFVPK